MLLGIHAILILPAIFILDISELLSNELDRSFWEAIPAEDLSTSVAPLNAGDSAGIVVLFLIVLFLYPLSYGATMDAIDRLHQKQPVTIRGALTATWRRILPLLNTVLWSILYITLAFLLLVIPAIYLYVRFLLGYQVVMGEDTGGRQALRRSGELLKGKMWLAFATAATLLGISGISVTLAEIIPEGVAYVIIDPIVQTLVCAFDSTVVALLYLACRQREQE